MCLICDRIEMIKNGTNKYFVKELETGYVVIGDYQHFKGYSLFLFKEHKTELFQLDYKTKMKFLEEMSLVAEAVSKESIKSIAVLDKSDSVNGAGGALFEDVTSAMYVNNKHVSTVNYIYGIGGRDTTADDIESVFEDLQKIQKDEKVENPYRYLGLRKE